MPARASEVFLRHERPHPVRPLAVATPAPQRSTAAKPAAYKILVVDDDPDIVELLEFNLKKEGSGI